MLSAGEFLQQGKRTSGVRWPCNMRFTSATLASVLVMTQMLVAMPAIHLLGLERVYFDQNTAAPPELRKVMPEEIQATSSSLQTSVRGDPDTGNDLEIRDFPLPLPEALGEVSLRQIVIGAQSRRITELWWVLYSNAQRSDVWHFTGDPRNTESKMLSNYSIESIVPSGDTLEIRVRGEMFRPQGAWWVTGKAFLFSWQGSSLVLSRVQNTFVFFQDYDIGDSPATIDVLTENDVNGGFESRSVDAVSDAVLRKCRFKDPSVDEDWKFNWTDMEYTALCVTKSQKLRTSYRAFDEPSFVERGGKSN
jgi:hypothetical protein